MACALKVDDVNVWVANYGLTLHLIISCLQNLKHLIILLPSPPIIKSFENYLFIFSFPHSCPVNLKSLLTNIYFLVTFMFCVIFLDDPLDSYTPTMQPCVTLFTCYTRDGMCSTRSCWRRLGRRRWTNGARGPRVSTRRCS